MKVAIVKQLLDTLGPWSTLRWGVTSPERLFDLWPGKGLHWEMITLFQADWYIVPQQKNSDYIFDSVLKYPGKAEILRKYSKCLVAPDDIPLSAYDLIITLDPILKFPSNSQTLFAYFVAEHWDWRYSKSLRRPLANADLFFAHMMDAAAALERLPQAISFPYVRDPKTMRWQFAGELREEAAWADWRMLAALSCGNGDPGAAALATAKRLEEVLRLPVHYRTFSPGLYYGEDPPRWGDAREYLRELGRQKYYLGLGRASGAGQGLADAASLGCICFGEQDKPYHRLICHPETLCGGLHELPRRFRRVRASVELQKKILAWQDENLARYFVEEPLKLLEQALQLKRGATGKTERTAVGQGHEAPRQAVAGAQR
jgi:hypothetical protein